MAANKFATMLHRNTNKITLILIYAILEWILILLLLLNSLFSYLIIKFADYFGLKRPCLWCSKVDHIFEPTKNKNSHRDLLCEVHATEISKLGYCSNHRKLAEFHEMCEDCSSSRPEFRGESTNYAFFPLMKQIGMVQSEGGEKMAENGEVGLKCSCCGVWFDRKFYSPCIVIKPSWDVLDYTQKGNLIAEAVDNEDDENLIEESYNSDRKRSDCVVDGCEDEHGIENKSDDQMVAEVSNGSFGVREVEAEEDCSVSVFNSGLRELEGDEDDKVGVVLGTEKAPIKEDDSNMTIEDPESDQMLPEVNNGGFGVREVEAVEDCSVSVSNSGLKELESDEDDKVVLVLGAEKAPIKEDDSDMIIGDPFFDETMTQICSKKDASTEILTQHLEFFVGHDGYGLIPIELFDSTTEENQGTCRVKEEDHGNFDNFELNWGFESHIEPRIEPVLENWCRLGEREAEVKAWEYKKEPEFAGLESMEIEENENSFIFHAKEFGLVRNVYEQVAITQATQTPSEDVDDVQATVAAEEANVDDVQATVAAEEAKVDDVQATVAAEEAKERDSDHFPGTQRP